VGEPVLSQRELRHALLARQLLLERSTLRIADAVEQVGGLQTQYAPSGYVGLWSRLAGFQRADLTAALEGRSVVQGTLLRGTIHIVSAREYWRYAMGIGRARREWMSRVDARFSAEAAEEHARALRSALDGGPRSVAELGALGKGFIGNVGLWVDLVRVPPSGTWERRRADILALADRWVGPPDTDEAAGLAHLVRAYLRAFGPARLRDVAGWSGVPVGWLTPVAGGMGLVRYRDETGKALLDLLGASIPDPAIRPPVRFLAHWDANLLVHARRTQILPERHRPRVFSSRNPFSVGVVLVDGQAAASWTIRDGHVQVQWWEEPRPSDGAEVEAEAARLDAFHQG
jgi:hypothetical protein